MRSKVVQKGNQRLSKSAVGITIKNNYVYFNKGFRHKFSLKDHDRVDFLEDTDRSVLMVAGVNKPNGYVVHQGRISSALLCERLKEIVGDHVVTITENAQEKSGEGQWEVLLWRES